MAGGPFAWSGAVLLQLLLGANLLVVPPTQARSLRFVTLVPGAGVARGLARAGRAQARGGREGRGLRWVGVPRGAAAGAGGDARPGGWGPGYFRGQAGGPELSRLAGHRSGEPVLGQACCRTVKRPSLNQAFGDFQHPTPTRTPPLASLSFLSSISTCIFGFAYGLSKWRWLAKLESLEPAQSY